MEAVKCLGLVLVGLVAGCGEVPKGIIQKQREADAQNAAAAEAAEAARTAQPEGERFNVVALEAEVNRILEESNAAVEVQRAEMEAIVRGDKPAPDKPAGQE